MFVEWPTGTSPRAAQGANDDCVMACAIALELYRQKGHWPDRHRRQPKDREPTYAEAMRSDPNPRSPVDDDRYAPEAA